MKIFKPKERPDLIACVPDNVLELAQLERFPGLSLFSGSTFVMPNKINVVSNLVPRLISTFKVVEVSPVVKQIANSHYPSVKEVVLPEWFHFHTEPLPHQYIALIRAYLMRNIGLLLDPGLGKTKVVLDLIHLLQIKLSLIVCPNALTYVWESEALIHRPEVKPYVFQSTDFEKEFETLRERGCNCIVLNYEKAVILKSFLLQTNIGLMALDEGLIKDPSTSRTQAMLELSRSLDLESRLIMSGSLINNSEADMFAPIQFLEPSLTGTSFHKFGQRYLVEEYIKDKATGDKIKFFSKTIKKDYKEELKGILESASIIMRKEEWLKNLPAKEVIDIYVELPERIRNDILELTSNMCLTLSDGSRLDLDNPLVLMSKVFQLSRGFCYIPEPDEDSDKVIRGELFDLFSSGPETREKTSKKSKKAGKAGKSAKPRKISHTFFYEEENPCSVEVIKLLTTTLRNEKVVIWFNTKVESMMLEKALTHNGISYETIYGGEKRIKDKVGLFNQDDSIQVLICQAKVINYGATLLGNKEAEALEDEDLDLLPGFNPKIANEIFYSMNFSLEVYLQQMDRIHRIGQTRVCRYWRIWVKDSWVDNNIRDTISRKVRINKATLIDITLQERESARRFLREIRGEKESYIEGLED